MRHARHALPVVMLAAASVALAAPPGREPLTLAEPAWKGSGPKTATSAYREALGLLQAVASRDPGMALVPLRVTSPAPCVLRLARGDDVAAFADASRAFLIHVIWIDLAGVSAVEGQAFGSTGTKVVSAVETTCAWLEGRPGFALTTDVVARAGSATAVRRVELAPEEQPRFCLGGGIGGAELTAPLRALAASCAETGAGTPGKR